MLRHRGAASYNFDQFNRLRRSTLGSVAFIVPAPGRFVPAARRPALALNVRKIPTRFLDISGIDRRCSSYFHYFYNSTQFARDQERAAFCIGAARRRANVSEQLKLAWDRGESAKARAPVDIFD